MVVIGGDVGQHPPVQGDGDASVVGHVHHMIGERNDLADRDPVRSANLDRVAAVLASSEHQLPEIVDVESSGRALGVDQALENVPLALVVSPEPSEGHREVARLELGVEHVVQGEAGRAVGVGLADPLDQRANCAGADGILGPQQRGGVGERLHHQRGGVLERYSPVVDVVLVLEGGDWRMPVKSLP